MFIKKEELARLSVIVTQSGTTDVELEKVVAFAERHGFRGVQVSMTLLAHTMRLARNSELRIAVVAGAKDGEGDARARAFEARHALDFGTDEVVVVLNRAALRSRTPVNAVEEVREVVKLMRDRGVLKLVVGMADLGPVELGFVSQCVTDCAVKVLMTGSGHNRRPAERSEVARLAELVRGRATIEAAGPLTDLRHADELLHAGASGLTIRYRDAVRLFG